MRERSGTSIEKAPFKRCPTCYRLTGSTEEGHDSMGSCRQNSRHVRAIPWPSWRWRARRRIDTGHAGQLHSSERARGRVQPRCSGGGRVRQGEGCRRRHRQKTEHRDGSPDGNSVEVRSAQKKSHAGGCSWTASSTGEIPVRVPHASLSVLLSRRATDHHLLATEYHWTSLVSTNGVS